MSEPQKEQLTALLDDIYGTFKASVAESAGKTHEEVDYCFSPWVMAHEWDLKHCGATLKESSHKRQP